MKPYSIMAPTPTTQGMSTTIMKHVIESVLAQPSDGPFATSLASAGVDLIPDLIAMTNEDIDALMMEQLASDNKTVTSSFNPW